MCHIMFLIGLNVAEDVSRPLGDRGLCVSSANVAVIVLSVCRVSPVKMVYKTRSRSLPCGTPVLSLIHI